MQYTYIYHDSINNGIDQVVLEQYYRMECSKSNKIYM